MLKKWVKYVKSLCYFLSSMFQDILFYYYFQLLISILIQLSTKRINYKLLILDCCFINQKLIKFALENVIKTKSKIPLENKMINEISNSALSDNSIIQAFIK